MQMNTGSFKKRRIAIRISRKNIFAFSFISVSLLTIISMFIMLLNISGQDDINDDGISASESFKSAAISGPVSISSDIIRESIAKVSLAAESKISGKAISESENGEYIPLIIEPARTTKVIGSTVDFFIKQLPSLRLALEKSDFYYSEKLLDPNTSTTAFILAANENCAQNLNGYFYYLIDEKGSTAIVSPFCLNISVLFDEENREAVVASGDYAETKHINALKNSLEAVLGGYYTNEAFDFIFSEYKRTFKERIDGETLQNPIVKLKISNLEIVFHNSFLTYVEFFVNK